MAAYELSAVSKGNKCLEPGQLDADILPYPFCCIFENAACLDQLRVALADSSIRASARVRSAGHGGDQLDAQASKLYEDEQKPHVCVLFACDLLLLS
jgi:hypothetical protein